MSFPYEKISVALVADLHPRTQDVLLRRFGLKEGEPETLEAIGQTHGITRERVRQIVEDGMAQVRERAFEGKERERLETIYEELGDLLGKSGYLKREDLFVREAGKSETANHIIFLLHLTDKFHRHKETDYAHPFWTTKEEFVGVTPQLLNAIIRTVKNHGQALEFEKLAKAHEVHDGEKISSRTLASLLEASKLLGRTHEGKWGLREWAEVYPRGVRDKAYIALRSAGKPLHFVEVARRIEELQDALDENVLTWKKKAALPQTVHNELIKDPRFVLVGRGTYALSEWGYEPGTVKDVIRKILRKKGKPMTKEEIIRETLGKRQVKESTILLTLQDKKCFQREDGGYVCIEEYARK